MQLSSTGQSLRIMRHRHSAFESVCFTPGLAPTARLVVSLLFVFLFLTASAAAAEEGPRLTEPGPARRWCHSQAHVNFNTWQLLVNLGQAITSGEKTLVQAEDAGFEESTRYRLRKALYDGSAARKELLDFVEMERTPASDPWRPTDGGEGPAARRQQDEDAELERDARVPCLIGVAIAIGVAAGGASIAAVAVASHTAVVVRNVDQMARATDLRLDADMARTADLLARHGVTTREIEENFNATDDNVRALINRTEQLSTGYRLRADIGNAISVLESLSTVARDLPHLVATINATGVVHPAYVPPEVWLQARELLTHDDRGRQIWLPEAEGANASWIHKNQTLVIHVPASCEVDPALLFRVTNLKHLNTSLVLRFAGWTDAKVLRTEELRGYQEAARRAAAEIEREREERRFMMAQQQQTTQALTFGVGVFVTVIVLVISVAAYFICQGRRDARDLALRAAEKGEATYASAKSVLADVRALREGAHIYDIVTEESELPSKRPPPTYSAYYGRSLPVPPTHKTNAAELRKLSAEAAAQDSLLPRPSQ
jgi:hypothetical protein